MSVYVDQLLNVVPKDPQARRLGHRWCHLFADTDEELHEFAQSIGLKREWFQDSPVSPHYDLTASRRQEAIIKGVTMITTKNYLRMRRRREAAN